MHTDIYPDELFALLRGEAPPLIVDVREPYERAWGVIEGDINIPLSQDIASAVPDRDQPLVIYCAAGVRSAQAVQELRERGYTYARSLAGGFGAWTGAGLPYVEPGILTPAQRERYSRHLLLPEIGESGQQRLLDARILLVGAGGLGSPAALYLAAAGIGTLGIVDADTLNASNLQRQVLYRTADIGTSKVEAARLAIAGLNPDVCVTEHRTSLTDENAADLLNGYDLVIDGADNLPTRYVLNDTAVSLHIPVIHGSVHRFEGQVTVFAPGRGPCYRCLFREPPPPEAAPSCESLGVLGVLPGVIGTLQATEALKLVLGIGEPLIGRLLLYDALAARFREVMYGRDPACPVCGHGARPTQHHV